MPISTLGALSIVIAACLLAGFVVSRRDGSLSSWLFAAGLLGAAAWSGLGLTWADSPPADMPATTFLTLFAMAVAGTIYFLDRARRGLPPT